MLLKSFTTIVLLASLSGLASAAAVTPKHSTTAPAPVGAPKGGKNSPSTHSKGGPSAKNPSSSKGNSTAPGNSALYGKGHTHGGPTTCPGGTKVKHACCCALVPIVQKMQTELFDKGECGEGAHSALRLAFHDAIGFSLHGNKGGGADGSILKFNTTEIKHSGNEGIDDITKSQTSSAVFQENIGKISPGDFVHLAAAVGVANCPGAPRLTFMHGRPEPKGPAADGTVPRPEQSVDAILARFKDAGFSPAEMVALLSSHTIAAADAIDTNIPGTPFDSTVSTFDTQIFLEVLLKGDKIPDKDGKLRKGEVKAPITGEMRLQSDFAIARDPRTACLWQGMIDKQEKMMTEFKAAMAKMQVLGQQKEALADCSEIIPVPKPLKEKIKFPPTFNKASVEIACKSQPFPNLMTTKGKPLVLQPVKDGGSLSGGSKSKGSAKTTPTAGKSKGDTKTTPTEGKPKSGTSKTQPSGGKAKPENKSEAGGKPANAGKAKHA